jgi:hypothetical protein
VQSANTGLVRSSKMREERPSRDFIGKPSLEKAT